MKEAFSSVKTRGVMRQMRCHLPYILRRHRSFGFSLPGALLLLLPTALYMRYRHKCCYQ